MRILVFASGTGSNFEALAKNFSIAALICDVETAPVIEKAHRLGVETIVLPKAKGETRSSYDERLWEAIRGLDFQLICLAGWMRLFSRNFLAKFPPETIMNIHPSLLPLYPGMKGYEETFTDKNAPSGITVHWIDEGMDTGLIINQACYRRDSNFETHRKNGLACEHELYSSVVEAESKRTRIYRVEVFPREKELLIHRDTLRSRVYWLKSKGPLAQLKQIAQAVLADPIAEIAFVSNEDAYYDHVSSLGFDGADMMESGFHPGVTDNAGAAATEALQFHQWLKGKDVVVHSGYAQRGQQRAKINPLLQWEKYQAATTFLNPQWLEVKVKAVPVRKIDLNVDDATLAKLNDENWWALTLPELKLVREFFVSQKREPTDVELEVIAQTWSEHCKHKIFRANIEYKDVQTGELKEIKSLFKTFVKGTTDEVVRRRNPDWLVSLFHDNAGIVRWDDNIDVAVKVETHNSPSALDPYGGALTGILGVNRDILGVGMGARPIANTDVFCLGHEGMKERMSATWPKELKAPEVIRHGVHEGVKDGGNKSGIPNVNGAFHYDVNFAGKPLVFCGTIGVLPQTIHGEPSAVKRVKSGDHIVMVGGRIGKDGLHGATFSSLEWKEGTPASVVQIGDPFTQKRVSDFILAARDQNLFTGLTDNGAGGLSSSVGEMATLTGGATLDLALAPVKYPGLSAWELMVSESQERMTVAVASEQLNAFMELSQRFGVESTALGTFNTTGVLEIRYGAQTVGSLPLNFLHEGLPAMNLRALWDANKQWNDWCENPWPKGAYTDAREALLTVLSSANVRSHESWVRQYDHEVQAASVVKQFSHEGVPRDAAVLALRVHGAKDDRGLAVSSGLNPQLSRFDTRTMALWAVDEAVRNAICVGADPERMALVDNFCWPDSVESAKNPDGPWKLAQLVRAAEGMADACVAYGLPLVSGKDSMKNDAHLKTPKGEALKISALPTLLMTCIAHVPDVKLAPPSSPTEAGLVVAMLPAVTKLTPVTLAQYLKVEATSPQDPDFSLLIQRYRQLHHATNLGLIHSAHDVSEGGVLTAAAEMALGEIGISLVIPSHEVTELFGEGPGMIVFTATKTNMAQIEQLIPSAKVIGTTRAIPGLVLTTKDGVYDWSQSELRQAHRGRP